jgi:methionyl-tRNA formyltransferase
MFTQKYSGPAFRFVFFGTSFFATEILNTLEQYGLTPTLIVATPDAPQGRRLILTSPLTKVWAESRGIPVFQPTTLKDGEAVKRLAKENADIFLVASYGKIIPQAIFELPKRKTLNIHPSLLPKLRGASPIQTAIVSDTRNTGVTIIQIDEKMDHGPIVAQEKLQLTEWPVTTAELKTISAKKAIAMLVNALPDWLKGTLVPKPQNEPDATFTKMISKADGEISLSGDPYQNFLKIKAYTPWPGTYFFVKKGDVDVRVIIKSAIFKNKALEILRIIPEGKKEMNYSDFLKGIKR